MPPVPAVSTPSKPRQTPYSRHQSDGKASKPSTSSSSSSKPPSHTPSSRSHVSPQVRPSSPVVATNVGHSDARGDPPRKKRRKSRSRSLQDVKPGLNATNSIRVRDAPNAAAIKGGDDANGPRPSSPPLKVKADPGFDSKEAVPARYMKINSKPLPLSSVAVNSPSPANAKVKDWDEKVAKLQKQLSRVKEERQKEADELHKRVKELESEVARQKEEIEGKGKVLEAHEKAKEDLQEVVQCGVCMDTLNDPHIYFMEAETLTPLSLSCGHIACKDCLYKWFRTPNGYLHPPVDPITSDRDLSYRTKTCHVCRAPVVRRPVRMFHLSSILGPLGIDPHIPTPSQAQRSQDTWEFTFPPDPTTYKVWDESDNLHRCPACGFEVEDGSCSHCGAEFSDADDEEDLDGLEDLEGLEDWLSDEEGESGSAGEEEVETDDLAEEDQEALHGADRRHARRAPAADVAARLLFGRRRQIMSDESDDDSDEEIRRVRRAARRRERLDHGRIARGPARREERAWPRRPTGGDAARRDAALRRLLVDENLGSVDDHPDPVYEMSDEIGVPASGRDRPLANLVDDEAVVSATSSSEGSEADDLESAQSAVSDVSSEEGYDLRRGSDESQYGGSFINDDDLNEEASNDDSENNQSSEGEVEVLGGGVDMDIEVDEPDMEDLRARRDRRFGVQNGRDA